MEIINNPEDESQGTRMVPFSREIYIEQEDFMENPPHKFFRLDTRAGGKAQGSLYNQVRRALKRTMPVR